MKYGLIGEKLSHSFSKDIHALIGDYDYEIKEIERENLEKFAKNRDFLGINVTIPYKEAIIPFLDEISDEALEIGAVNTVVNKNGRLIGYNTDFYGMKALIEKNNINVYGKKAIILGTGGTSKTARCVLGSLGANEIIVVSRKEKPGCVTYEELYKFHNDAQIIVNTTPCGMYPDTEKCPLSLDKFDNLEGVIDAIYNPIRSNLIVEAQKRNVASEGGLYMLVAQGVRASELFFDKKYEPDMIEKVYKKILSSKENIVFIGMPGSGKTTIGKALCEIKGGLIDTDEEIVKRINCSIKDYINDNGEAEFRKVEEDVVFDASLKNNSIISTGGGVVLKEKNVIRLKRNGRIVFLDMPLDRIVPTCDRPLSDNKEKLKAVYDKRIDLYKGAADIIITPTDDIYDTAKMVREALEDENCNN